MNWLCLFSIAAASSLTAASDARQVISGTPHVGQQRATVNFNDLASRQEFSLQPREGFRPQRPKSKLTLQNEPAVTAPTTEFTMELSLAPSPPVTASFLALLDNGYTTPPDTMGAVGPNHIMTTLNSQVRIQNRTGSDLSTVSMDSFWSSLGNPDAFDPRVAYDPFNNRWIFTAAANPDLAAAAILVGVSETSDPTGNWFLYKTDVDPANQNWADFDALGFNKDWVVVSANVYKNHGAFQGVWFWVFDKTDLYANGSGKFTLLKSTTDNASSVAPAQMHDNSLATMYLVEDWDGSAGQIRVSTITGSVGAEVLTIGTSLPTASNTWTYFGTDDFAPQLGTTRGIDAGDSRILSCSYRNGSLWASHTAFVPAASPTHSVAQWWQFLPDGTVQQFGRIEDPSGAQFFAFPTIAANASNDVLIGYSRFSAEQSASANYAYRFATDPPNSLRHDTVLHAGEGLYLKTDGTVNRWGDYSATCVDPVNDLTMWTIQEYASTNRWSTWWGRIDPDLSALKLVLTGPADGIRYPSQPTVTFAATRFDPETIFTRVEFFADGAKVGESTNEPYTATWSGATDGVHSFFASGTEPGGGTVTSEVINVTVGDPASPIGTWETKLTGPGKGTAVVTFGDDFSVTGHGMTLGQFGLFTISGTWGFDSKHLTAATFTETLDGSPIYSGNITAKITAGKKLTAKGIASVRQPVLKLKGLPRVAVPDLTGSWTATVNTSSLITTETYDFAASPTSLNVFDFIAQTPSGTITGTAIETVKGVLNASTANFPRRTLAGKSKLPTFTLKGADERTVPINIKATQP
jgi:hypothetical protein